MNPLNRYAAIVTWAVLTCAGATGALGQADSRKPDTEWRGYNGGYDATRFSPLTQIDPKTNMLCTAGYGMVPIQLSHGAGSALRSGARASLPCSSGPL